MRRVGDNRNPVKDKFGPGKNGFGPGNPQTGQPATTPGYEIFDSLQEEVAGVVESTGTELNPNQYDQLLNAIRQIAWGNKFSRPNTLAGYGIADAASKTELITVAPPGLIVFFAMQMAPTGWLKCDGSTVSRTTYAALFAAIGTTFGVGNGSSTFHLPDLRGGFVRGWDDGNLGADTGRVFASTQQATRIANAVTGTSGGGINVFIENGEAPSVATNSLHTTGTIYSGQLTTYAVRPRNIALLPCIKF